MLFTIGLIFMSVAVARLIYGTAAAAGASCPTTCSGQLHLLGRDFPTYRVFLIVFSVV